MRFLRREEKRVVRDDKVFATVDEIEIPTPSTSLTGRL